MALSLLLLRRFALSSLNPKPRLLLSLKPYSSSSSSSTTTSPDPTSSLSARMSFVFDQIDAIERERLEKDKTLQRIRAWRESKNNSSQPPPPPPPPQEEENAELVGSKNEGLESNSVVRNSFEAETRSKKELEVVHPWPEWIELVERLIGHNYFDHRRRDEDRLVNLGIDGVETGNEYDDGSGDVEIDVNDFKTVQTACLNFGKDRFDILRSLSRQDIQHLVGYGCPTVDRKVVFSAKVLRKHVHLDEGDVCSNCSLRSSCDKGFLLLNKEDEARTIDVMRVLLTYGFDHINGLVANKSLLKQKTVKTAVRKLLHEVVKLSAVPIDPNLPPPVIKKAPPKVKQPPPPPKKRVGRDDIEMKKGDWLCPKCDFMNFAKNTVCLKCDAKRPKRQLLPGEWECPECNFLNYRRNMTCFHCECKRPSDAFVENKMEERQHGRQTRLEKISNRAEVSNAWNFDFDDDESDGADVAAFEYADSAAIHGDSSPGGETREGKFRELDDDVKIASRFHGAYQREHYQSDHNRERRGFDDFDDEDDIDSYELETENSPSRKAFQDNFSQGISDSEDVEVPHINLHSRPSTSSQSHMKTSKHKFSDFEDDELDFDLDEERSVHPKWKSSHAVEAKHKNTHSDTRHQLRRPSFGSDEELELDSDADDDCGSRGRKNSKCATGRKKFCSNSDLHGVSFSDFQSDDDVGNYRGNKSPVGKLKIDKRVNRSQRNSDYGFASNTEIRYKGNMGGRKSSWNDDFERSSRGNYGNDRRFRDNSRGRQRSNNRGIDSWNNNVPNRAGIQSLPQGRSRGYDTGIDKDFGEFRNSRRVNTR